MNHRKSLIEAIITPWKQKSFYAVSMKKRRKIKVFGGGGGVIEAPPDFMFVDWTVIDGYTMHHPPKALGQTVLNAFYYEALNRAAEIYDFLDNFEKAENCRIKAKQFYIDFNREFYDKNKQL